MLSCVAIDDDNLFLMNLELYIEEIPWLSLKATFNNPVKGATGIIELEPDVLFIDLEMPHVEGYDLIDWIKPRLKLLPQPPKIVVISGREDKMMHDNPDIFLHLTKHGIKGPGVLAEQLAPLKKLL